MRVTVLGCGSSGGVPLSDGTWGKCDPAESRNRRRRPSILIERDGTTILVDTGPDMREQLLDAGCDRIDAILFTHAHADHVHGLDDLRAFNYRTGHAIDAWGSAETLDGIRRRFGYVFDLLPEGSEMYRPQVRAHVIGGPFAVGGIGIVPYEQDHMVCRTTGFRIGDFAYSTDVVRLDDRAFDLLAGIRVWVVGCLRDAPHPCHAHVARVLEWVRRLRPERTVLTHMNHLLDYRTLRDRLPPGVEPGYDGMVLEVGR
ncbi:MAG: MBL fold metallo-hydrolase [Alphaproteobacteria bacterium]